MGGDRGRDRDGTGGHWGRREFDSDRRGFDRGGHGFGRGGRGGRDPTFGKSQADAGTWKHDKFITRQTRLVDPPRAAGAEEVTKEPSGAKEATIVEEVGQQMTPVSDAPGLFR